MASVRFLLVLLPLALGFDVGVGVGVAFVPAHLSPHPRCSRHRHRECAGPFPAKRGRRAPINGCAPRSPLTLFHHAEKAKRAEWRHEAMDILTNMGREQYAPGDGDGDGDGGDWTRARNYLYKTKSDTLPLSQIRAVASFLCTLFGPSLAAGVVQAIPRVLRRDVETQLRPTITLLRQLYPATVFLQAIERNPKLLVTSGVGYNGFRNNRIMDQTCKDVAGPGAADGTSTVTTNSGPFADHSSGAVAERWTCDENRNEAVATYLMQELGLTQDIVSNLKKMNPVIFSFSVERQIRPVTGYLSALLNNVEDSESGKGAVPPLDNVDMEAALARIIKLCPAVLGLCVETNLRPKVEFLADRCGLVPAEVARKMVQAHPPLLALSLEKNLRPTVTYLSNVLLDIPDDDAAEGGLTSSAAFNRAREPLRKCLTKHPQILALGADNIRAKVAYMDEIDRRSWASTSVTPFADEYKDFKHLASRVLVAAPSAYSLSLGDNIVPTLECLARFWGFNPPPPAGVECVAIRNRKGCLLSQEHCTTAATKPSVHAGNKYCLPARIAEYPAVLTLSLNGNLVPTIDFYNSTGYVTLDRGGRWRDAAEGGSEKTKGDMRNNNMVRSRYLATSLYNRLLPRWHFWRHQEKGGNKTNIDVEGMGRAQRTVAGTDGTKGNFGATDDAVGKSGKGRRQPPPLHVLAGSSDPKYCSWMGCDIKEYKRFRAEEGERIKFGVQFANWVKTGRPIS